jgi:hypothetical protein
MDRTHRNYLLWIALSLLLLLYALKPSEWLREFWAIDKCLDHGGVWHDQLRACERTLSDKERYGANHH